MYVCTPGIASVPISARDDSLTLSLSRGSCVAVEKRVKECM